MKLVNLTGHEITDINTGQCFQPDGIVRTTADSEQVYRVKGIPVFRSELSAKDPLPDPVEGVVLIVSNLYLNLVPERTDVVAPGKVVRENGKAVACRGFRCN